MPPLEIIAPVFCLGVLATIGRVSLGSWIAPGAFFPAFWTALLALSLGQAARYPVWAPALWWIDGSILVFFVGSLLGQGWAVRQTRAPPSPLAINLPGIELTIVGCGVLGIGYIVFRETFAPGLDDSPPAWFQPLLSAMYAAPIFGGILFGSQPQRRGKAIAVLSLLPTLIYSVAFLGRSPMAAGLFHWCAGFWIARSYRLQGHVGVVTAKTIALGIAGLVGMSIIGAAILPLRQTGNIPLKERLFAYQDVLETSDPEKEWESFRSSIFGHPYSFSYYLRRALDYPPVPQNGALIFGGPLELLGVHRRVPFEDLQMDPGVQSNVYTLFRPPIDDFGLAGSFVSFLVAGLLAGWAYGRISRGALIWAPILSSFYPHILTVGGFFFAYNSFILAHAMVGAYLLFIHRRIRNRNSAAPLFSPPHFQSSRMMP